MTDSDPSDKPMRVVLEKEDTFDISFEQGTLDEAGIRVENAVPIEALQELVDEWREHRRNDDLKAAHIEIHDFADELQAVIDKHD